MLREGRGSGTEFRYRAVDERPTPHPPLPPPSGYSYFTEQAIRAGYMAPGFGRMYENFQNPILVQDEIQRELEKERIREEVIAAEVAWRRVLEAEVRREMRLERELAVQGRGGDGFDRLPFLPRAGMRFEPRDLAFGQVEGRSLEERIAMSVGERFGNGARQDIGDYEIVPFQERSVKPKIGGYGTIPSQQRAMEPKIPEVTHTSEVGKEKEKIVFLVKPEANFSGAKRKLATPPEDGTSQLPLIGVRKKKVKEEWSCAVCQVSATSEHALNEHIQGKKHKSKEAALRAQRNSKNIGIGIGPKKATKSTKLGESSTNSSSKQGGKPIVQLLQSNQTRDSVKIIPIKRSTEESEVPLVEVIQKANIIKNEVLEAGTEKKLENKKKKFRFWCKMCHVGAYSETVMEAHRTGKKHVLRLEEAIKKKNVQAPEMGSTEINNGCR